MREETNQSIFYNIIERILVMIMPMPVPWTIIQEIKNVKAKKQPPHQAPAKKHTHVQAPAKKHTHVQAPAKKHTHVQAPKKETIQYI
jgi:ABC-type nickel/cobalt efflux system permease component RcnA